MTTTYHDAITAGAAANAATFNAPLSQIDTQLTATQAEITTARSGYASLDGRLSALVLAGGNVATLANGAASAGQKVVTVDSTTGFVAGAYVAYALNGGNVEYNSVDAVNSATQLTMDTNIGTGGILDNTYIAMISASEYQAANAINHSDDLTLRQTVAYLARDAYMPEAYGAVGDGVTDDTAAWQAMLTAIKARSGTSKRALVQMRVGANYLITDSLDCTNVFDIVFDGGSMETTITYADDNATATNRVLFDCLGSGWLTFRNFKVIGDTTDIPAVAISFGRSNTSENAGTNLVERVYIYGYWSLAAIYAISAELTTIRNVWVLANGPDTNTTKYGLYISTKNDLSVGSAVTRSATESSACQWISNCNVGTTNLVDSRFIPIYLHGVGSAAIRDSYVYTYDSMPAVKIAGNNDGVVIDNLLVEGAPDKSIHFAAYSGGGTISDVTLHNCAFGAYANNGIYSDAGTTVRRLSVAGCTGGKTGTSNSYITFAGDVENSDIAGWWTYTAGGVTAANFYYSRLRVSSHTLTISNAAGSEIKTDATGADHYQHFQTNVRIGTVGATNLAQIRDIRTASKSWAPGEIADNGDAGTYVGCAGVTRSDAWFCMAHYAGLDGYNSWEIAAVAGDGAIGVTVVNRTGGAVTPTGTLSVVAWRIAPV